VLFRSRSLPGADLRVADAARRTPYDDGSFGLVLMFTALSSMQDRQAAAAAVEEAGRVLKPAGLLAVYEPALPNPFNRHRLTIGPADLVDWARPRMEPRSVTRLTVAPPLARGISRISKRAYDMLGRVPFLLTHRLIVLSRV